MLTSKLRQTSASTPSRSINFVSTCGACVRGPVSRRPTRRASVAGRQDRARFRVTHGILSQLVVLLGARHRCPSRLGAAGRTAHGIVTSKM